LSRIGDIEVLKWMKKNSVEIDLDGAFEKAAGKGDLEQIKWLKQEVGSWHSGVSSTLAEKGNLDLLKEIKELGCPIDEKSFRSAAVHDRNEVLKWLITINSPRDDIRGKEWLIENGNVEIMKLIKDEIKSLDKITLLTLIFSRFNKNKQETLEFFSEIGISFDNTELFPKCRKEKDCTLLTWIIEKNKLIINEDIIMSSAEYDDTKSFQFLLNIYGKDKLTENILKQVIKYDSTKIMRFIFSLKPPSDFHQIKYIGHAAEHGSFKIMKLMKQNKFKWDETTSVLAAGSGNQDMIEWMIKENCPYDIGMMKKFAEKEGKWRIVEWFDKMPISQPSKTETTDSDSD